MFFFFSVFMFFVLCARVNNNNNNNKCISDRLMHVAAWHRRAPESKFTKFGKEMSSGQTHNRAEFCGDLTRSVQDIRDLKCVLQKKWEKIHQNRLRPAVP